VIQQGKHCQPSLGLSSLLIAGCKLSVLNACWCIRGGQPVQRHRQTIDETNKALFYHRSLELVLARRWSQQPASTDSDQIKVWNRYVYVMLLIINSQITPHRLLGGVDSILEWGVQPKLCDEQPDKANATFENQYLRDKAYIEKYQGPQDEKLVWEEVAKKDRIAGGWFKKVKADVHTKVMIILFLNVLFFLILDGSFEVNSYLENRDNLVVRNT